jgi:hypothetical protein
MARTDDGCGVLFGVMRDCAYHIRAEAERERDEHELRGEWNEQGASSTERPDRLAKGNGDHPARPGAVRNTEKAKSSVL